MLEIFEMGVDLVSNHRNYGLMEIAGVFSASKRS
jgi:hypothetical protein